MKRLIVNADDFGITAGVNEGIVRAHREGILTSASLMVMRPGAEDAARLALQNPGLGVGLHVELPAEVFGRWLAGKDFDEEETARIVAAQLDAFRALAGRMQDHSRYP